jgi:hypothetical protein
MTRYTTYRNWPVPDYKEKPYDPTIVPGTFAAMDADVQTALNNSLNTYESIGTVSAPGELRQNVGGAAGVLAFATGFSSDNDGGQGIFVWVVGSTTDDGGTRIVPTGSPGGYWQRLFDGAVYRSKWFGMSTTAPNNAGILNSLIGSIGSENASIVIQQDPDAVNTDYGISANVTFPSNITLQFERGARFDVASSYTVTINGIVEAGPYQIFTGSGNVAFVGGQGWTDWYSEINDAVNSGLINLHTSGGIHVYNEDISVPSGIVWQGYASYLVSSGNTTILKPSSSVHKAIKLEQVDSVKITDMTVRMDNTTPSNTVGPATTISFATAVDGGTITDSANGFGSLSVNTLIGVAGSTSNDGTYHVETATAGSLVVKGPPLTNESAGASITIREGPIGLRVQGSKRGYFENLNVVVDIAEEGMGGIYMTPYSDSTFSSYYNNFVSCGIKSEGTKKGVGVFASQHGIGAVTNNLFMMCPVQSWRNDFVLHNTGSGFQILACNGESALNWGIFVTDTPSAVATAVKVKNGEWTSAGAGAIEALLMEDCTINNGAGPSQALSDNVTKINFGKVQNSFVQGDFFIDTERPHNTYVANDTIYPTEAQMFVSGDSGPITLDTTTPIYPGYRGQLLRLMGGSNTNPVQLLHGGTVFLTQGAWYGNLGYTIDLVYSTSFGYWKEITRAENKPFVVRTPHNAFFEIPKPEEYELTLSGASSNWVNAIAVNDEIDYVLGTVTEAITGAGVTGFQIGRVADPDHWGNITGIVIGTKSFPSNFTDTSRFIAQATQDIVVTAIGGTFTGGKIRLVKFYRGADAPDD